MLSAEDVMLVRASFARVAAIKDAAADLFYDRLFEVAPQVRSLFPDDLAEQKMKLMGMLAMAVGALGDINALVPQVKALGARHVAYGAELAHYNVVGQVLLWTLEKGLGDAFTPEVRTAWFKVYSLLATTMQVGAAEAAAMQAAE